MSFSNNEIERRLLESSAGQAVYDALIQANISLRNVPLEMIKQMLVAECQFRRGINSREQETTLTA